MSDTDEKTQGGGQEDNAILNTKAELTRKLAALEDRVSKQNQEILNKLSSIGQPAAPKAQASEDSEELSDLLYTDPEKYSRKIEERAERRVMKKIEQSQAEQGKTATVMSQLVSAYPELQDGNHELTLKAVELYNGMAEDDKRSPLAYKLAVKEAASELGIKERSKRAEGEDFIPSRSSGAGAKRKRAETLDPMTEAFAAMLAEKGFKSVDPNNKEVRERLTKRQGRNWNKFE